MGKLIFDKEKGRALGHRPENYWFDTDEDQIEVRPMLQESLTVDIAIMGAGFTGLWTAYYLLRQNPSLHIAILEKNVVGFGASGRNGGACMPVFPVSPAVTIERYGKETAQNLLASMFETVTEIEQVIKEENIDADWKRGGSIQVALGEYGLPSLENQLKIYRSLGFEHHFRCLNKEKVDERVAINGVKAGLFTKYSAVLHPGKLVRQLAKVLEQRGVKIYEQTEVLDYKLGNANNHPRLMTRNGVVTARHSCVLAGEAYTSRFNNLHRNILPTYSLITITEPLSKEQWSTIGWEQREIINSTRLSVDYLQRTKDGRILFGGRGRPYPFASKIKDSYDVHRKTHNRLQQRLIQWFPSLSGIKFTHSWGGPLGITRDWTPNIVYDKQTRIASAWGYVGVGVSVANLAGRILSDLMTEKTSTITNLPMTQHISKRWEIEPFRWIGARYVQYGLERLDKKAEMTDNAPKGRTLAERLSHH